MRLLTVSVGLFVLGAIFGLIEWRWPSVRGQKRVREGFRTDLVFYAYTTTLGKLVTGVLVGAGILAVARLLSVPITLEHLRGLTVRDTFISRQPVGLQLIEFVLLADLIGYWNHRAFHTFGRMWRIHAVHHSSTQVDWLSAVRLHPLNEAISNFVIATPLLLLGFSQVTLAAYLPLLALYGIALHANVSWGYGPVGRIIASPRFHRWHHSTDPAAIDKNFAGLFVFYDWLFGTLYLPKDVQPARFGVTDGPLPESFLGQIAYPFKRPVPAEVPLAAT